MANKYEKRYSTSYVMREIQMITMNYNYIHVTMAKTQIPSPALMLLRMWSNRNSGFAATGHAKWYNHLEDN